MAAAIRYPHRVRRSRPRTHSHGNRGPNGPDSHTDADCRPACRARVGARHRLRRSAQFGNRGRRVRSAGRRDRCRRGRHELVAPDLAHLRRGDLGGLACEWNNGQPNDLYPGRLQPLVHRGASARAPERDEPVGALRGLLRGFGRGRNVVHHVPHPRPVNSINWSERIGCKPRSPGHPRRPPPRARCRGRRCRERRGAGRSAVGTARRHARPPGHVRGSCCHGDSSIGSGVSATLVASTDGGGWSLWAGARENWGGPRCNWLYEFSDSGVGFLASLPGGAWVP